MDSTVYFEINGHIYDTDAKKIALMLSLMTSGEALSWKEQWYLALPQNTQGQRVFPALANFYQDIQAAFTPVEQEANSMNQLNTMKQGATPAEEHVTNFKLLLGKANVPRHTIRTTSART